MFVELHDELRRAERLPASRVVIYDDFGNPIFVAVQLNGQHTVMAVPGSGEKGAYFHKLLRQLGITKTVVVDQIAGG